MLTVLFWIVFSLLLLILVPDRWHARREIAKRQGLRSALRRSKAIERTISGKQPHVGPAQRKSDGDSSVEPPRRVG
jgi:hypothetical protein